MSVGLKRPAPPAATPASPPPVPAPAATISGLVKRYGEQVAVDGLDLDVPAGRILALVGPNGSGKTTTVECLEGLRRPDAGTIRVLGMDPRADRRALHSRLGVLLQEGAVYDRIRVGEALWLQESFFARPRPAGELLDALGLRGCERTLYGRLSGGQKRRVQLALALVGDPELLVLDEPTSGLDPQARAGVWDVLARLRAAGRTILVTTHQLDEAEEHADRVAIVERGRVLADDAPAALLDAYGLRTRAIAPLAPGLGREQLAALPGVVHVEALDERLVLHGDPDAMLAPLLEAARRAGVGADALEIRRARLEDLFLMLTGREYRAT